VAPGGRLIRGSMLFLSVVLLLAGCGASASEAKSRVSLSLLVAHVTDFPKGSSADVAIDWNTRQKAKRDYVTIAPYLGHGWVESYSATFLLLAIGGLPTSWMERAASEITEYRDVAGASWDYARQKRALAHSGVSSFQASATNSTKAKSHVYPYRPGIAVHIGDESSAYTVTWPSDEVSYTTRIILSRQGRFVSYLQIVADLGWIPWQKAIGVARKVEARIVAHTG